MHSKQTLLGVIVLAMLALFPAAANACVAFIPRPPKLSFWDESPKAQDGEVVLQVRLARFYQPDPTQGDGRCHPDPAVFVFDVVSVAAGDFEPKQVYLYGSGGPEGETGWLVGKPATLYMKHIEHIMPRTDGESPTAEHPSIEWRPPPCRKGYVCQPPNLRVLQP